MPQNTFTKENYQEEKLFHESRTVLTAYLIAESTVSDSMKVFTNASSIFNVKT